MRIFEQRFPIRIHDVDAAGIVFFARYYVLMHDVYESFMETIGHGISRAIVRGEILIPVIHSEARYFRPMRHGEVITGRLTIHELRHTSYVVQVDFIGADDVQRSRLRCRHICVNAGTMKPEPLPESLRQALSPYVPAEV
jgi:YbgC/YbaW family acyl-CoA thioester hydrolase